jgi:hypothetical protein
MKLQNLRNFVTISIAVFAISCSSDETNTINSNRPSLSQASVRMLQIKKVTQLTYYSSVSFDMAETDFIYNGNRLIGLHTIDDMNRIYDSELLYNGLKIIQINQVENGTPSDTTHIFYNGNMISSTISDQNQNYRTDYSFNNGYISSRRQYYIGNDVPELLGTVNFTYQSGNVVEEVRSSAALGSVPSHITYTYENKNNPTRGMNKYFQVLFGNEGFDGLSRNNPITRSYYNEGNESNITTQDYQMVYNSDNFPINIKRFSNSGALISDTTIEYR